MPFVNHGYHNFEQITKLFEFLMAMFNSCANTFCVWKPQGSSSCSAAMQIDFRLCS